MEELQLRLLDLQAGRRAALRVGGVHERTLGALAALRGEQQATIAAALAAAIRQAWRFALALLVLVAAVCAALAGLFRGVRRGVLRPLHELAGGARRVSEDADLSFTVRASGDAEVAGLGRAFRSMVERLRDLVTHTKAAMARLVASADELGALTRAQQSNVSRQATALAEARQTSGVVLQAARSAADQASSVLRVAEQAEALGREGDQALSRNAEAAQAVEGQTRQLIGRILELVNRAERVAAITDTVRGLAQQSHVVALNASIEASRAGAAGAGFAVVAAEMRSLADQSIRATLEVRTVLTEVLKSIREAARLVEDTSAGLQDGTTRTARLAECVADLTGIVRENLAAVRQIAAVVATQGGGMGQISAAVEDLTGMMGDTVQGATTTGEAAGVLREVAAEVSSAVELFRV
jgi:methyl-accepting chemotaxis protein